MLFSHSTISPSVLEVSQILARGLLRIQSKSSANCLAETSSQLFQSLSPACLEVSSETVLFVSGVNQDRLLMKE